MKERWPWILNGIAWILWLAAATYHHEPKLPTYKIIEAPGGPIVWIASE